MKRHTPYVTIAGTTKSVAGWLQEVGMAYSTYAKRIQNGMTQEEAITKVQSPEEIALGVAEWHNKLIPPEKKKKYKFVRNSGCSGTWREVEE